MAQKKGICQTDGCTDEAKKCGFCDNCYSYVRRWQQQNAQHAIDRTQQIMRWVSRMEYVLPSKVKIPRYKKKKSKPQHMPGYTKNKKHKVA
jgi:hypothetical protein